jgi:hypothetical protein
MQAEEAILNDFFNKLEKMVFVMLCPANLESLPDSLGGAAISICLCRTAIIRCGVYT